MFVFASMLTAATWFLVRLGYDLVLPTHRTDVRRTRRRFATITIIGALIAGGGFVGVIGAVYGWVPGLITGAVIAVGYCLFVLLLRTLINTWHAGDGDVDGYG